MVSRFGRWCQLVIKRGRFQALETGERQLKPLYTVSDGIGLTSDVAYVKAFDLRDGKQLWKFDIPVRRDAPAPGGGKGCPWGGQLSVVGTSLFFGSCSGDVYRLDLRSGRRVWTRDVSRYPMSSAPSVAAGSVYIGGVNTVVALDARTGRVRWKVRLKYVWRTVLRDDILIADTGTWMAALDARTGKNLWSTRQERTDLQAHGDHLYECYPAFGEPSYLKVRSVATGKVTQRFNVHCQRLLIRGDIIVASNLKSVFALSRETGKQLWSRRARRKVGFAVVQDQVLIASANKLVATDLLTGKESWTFASAHGILEPTNPVTPAVLHDGSDVCSSTSKGWVYCLAAATRPARARLRRRRRMAGNTEVDEALSERHTDLLYSVPWQQQTGDDVRKVLLYVLFEHQSSVDWIMTFRMAAYSVRIWDLWMREHPDRRLLPPILPLVLYHGEQGWTAATELQDLFDLEGVDPVAVDALRPYLPSLRILVNELGKVPDEMLPRVPVVQQTLLLFKWGRHPDMLEYLRAWEDGFRAVADQDKPGLRILRLFVQYQIQVNDHVTEEALTDFLVPLGEEAKELPMSIGQQIREEGLKEGLQKGRKEGREALLKTARRLLARGMDPAEVTEATGLPLEEVQALTH